MIEKVYWRIAIDYAYGLTCIHSYGNLKNPAATLPFATIITDRFLSILISAIVTVTPALSAMLSFLRIGLIDPY